METAVLEEAEVTANTIPQNTYVVLVVVKAHSLLRCPTGMTVSINGCSMVSDGRLTRPELEHGQSCSIDEYG
jgi:hypothetical protein